jgi:glycosyltransferase involved in cell wall biosynthesis
MRIGIDARFYGSLGKGLGRYTEKLITYLEGLPEDPNTYVIFLRLENFNEYQPAYPRFTKIIADYPWYGWAEQLLFPILLWRERLDLIHFPHFNVPLILWKPFIVTIHDLILLHFPTVKASELPPFLYWLKYLAYRIVIASAVKRARSIIAVSDFTKQDIETIYPDAKGKVYTTLEAVDPYCQWLDPVAEQSLLRSLALIDADTAKIRTKRFVLYVGNAYPHKNLELLLAVAPKFPDTVFLCVGKEDYFYRSFREKVSAAQVGNIRFTGYVDDRSLGALYRRASAYVFPSFYEGFGLPGLEAMNYGLPVVAARAGSLPEIYAEAALYFDPRDMDTCFEALRKSLDEAERPEYRTRGFNRVARFSWRGMAMETLRLYNREASQTPLK